MKNIFLLLGIIYSISVNAQKDVCNGERYIYSTFSDVIITKNIQFGKNKTMSGVEQNLYMDIYEPKEDSETERALLILAFGGAFIEGERSDMEQIAISYAKKGYVVSSIDYRLYDGDSFSFIIDTTIQLNVIIQGMSDYKAAIRYFKQNYAENLNEHKIDTGLIFAGGVSSGAILANHVGLIDPSDSIPSYLKNLIDSNGGWYGNSSSNTNYSSNVAGIINFSGALKEVQWIDKNDVPVFSVHDVQDYIVPYGSAQAKLIFNLSGSDIDIPLIYLQGSKEIHDALSKMHVKSELISIETNEHVSYLIGSTVDTFLDSIENSSSRFMKNIICDYPNPREKNSIDFKIYPNPTSGFLRIHSQTPIQKIEIIDLSGRIAMMERNVDQISLEGLKKGHYIIKVTSSKAFALEKIILK